MAGIAPEAPGQRAHSPLLPLPAPEEKHHYVQGMFDAIAPRYDLLNSLLSARLHHGWRRVAADAASLKMGDTALDVCTGTGDFAFELARRVGPKGRVVATDFAALMLRLGAKKRVQENLHQVQMSLADTQRLPFADNQFDAVTVGFGIRNVADVNQGIQEMARVARPGGRVVILEFNRPINPWFARIYQWYSFHILPVLGGMVSGRRAAYEYLPLSVAAFYSREEIAEMMRNAGLQEIRVINLMFGAVVIHRGVKS
jgi:demethylmenaquinone methyltransferase/2-methoxy-6-polyprenyl-1,4-benzoquinol methylase